MTIGRLEGSGCFRQPVRVDRASSGAIIKSQLAFVQQPNWNWIHFTVAQRLTGVMVRGIVTRLPQQHRLWCLQAIVRLNLMAVVPRCVHIPYSNKNNNSLFLDAVPLNKDNKMFYSTSGYSLTSQPGPYVKVRVDNAWRSLRLSRTSEKLQIDYVRPSSQFGYSSV